MVGRREMVKDTLSLRASTENIERFIEHAQQFMSSVGLVGQGALEVELALEELIVNIVSYAYSNNSENKYY